MRGSARSVGGVHIQEAPSLTGRGWAFCSVRAARFRAAGPLRQLAAIEKAADSPAALSREREHWHAHRVIHTRSRPGSSTAPVSRRGSKPPRAS